jgi:hypothetical protein
MHHMTRWWLCILMTATPFSSPSFATETNVVESRACRPYLGKGVYAYSNGASVSTYRIPPVYMHEWLSANHAPTDEASIETKACVLLGLSSTWYWSNTNSEKYLTSPSIDMLFSNLTEYATARASQGGDPSFQDLLVCFALLESRGGAAPMSSSLPNPDKAIRAICLRAIKNRNLKRGMIKLCLLRMHGEEPRLSRLLNKWCKSQEDTESMLMASSTDIMMGGGNRPHPPYDRWLEKTTLSDLLALKSEDRWSIMLLDRDARASYISKEGKHAMDLHEANVMRPLLEMTSEDGSLSLGFNTNAALDKIISTSFALVLCGSPSLVAGYYAD